MQMQHIAGTHARSCVRLQFDTPPIYIPPRYMTAEEFESIIASRLPYAPNFQQKLVIGALARFCSPRVKSDAVFVLNGYAGTGKTSLCGALVRSLPDVGMKAVLLAPTGRAAKVFAAHSGHSTFTIHRRIYRHSPMGAPGDMSGAEMAENKSADTLFIVDEASMISGEDTYSGNLLADLIHYVFTGQNCRLLLLGDTAQLPPVGCPFSAAMDTETLRSFGLRVSRATLTQVARQGAHSGILYNATLLRRNMRLDPLPVPELRLDFPDVNALPPDDVPEVLYSSYNRTGIADTIVITRSNLRAAAFNREIRSSVLYYEHEIEENELLIVAKNNYHWTRSLKGADFIANGDILRVTRVFGTETRYGMRFADVEVTFADSDTPVTAKIMLDVLASDDAAITREQMQRLYQGIMSDPERFSPMTPMQERQRALLSDPYWNALQVKYAYCVTCHKAQGGQWSNVIIDMAGIPPDAMGEDFYRWLYTAVTRASKMLYFIGSPE